MLRKKYIRLISTFILLLAPLLILFTIFQSTPLNYQLTNHAAGNITSIPLISRGKPAWVSSSDQGGIQDTRANDANYNTTWRSNQTVSSSTPAWIAYDLSSVTDSLKAQVDAVYYNDLFEDYNHVGFSEAYNNPGSYQIKISPL